MIKEIAPGVRRVTLMFSPGTSPFYPAFLRELGAAPETLAVELSTSPVHDEAAVEAAITAFAHEPGGGLIAAPDVILDALCFISCSGSNPEVNERGTSSCLQLKWYNGRASTTRRRKSLESSVHLPDPCFAIIDLFLELSDQCPETVMALLQPLLKAFHLLRSQFSDVETTSDKVAH